MRRQGNSSRPPFHSQSNSHVPAAGRREVLLCILEQYFMQQGDEDAARRMRRSDGWIFVTDTLTKKACFLHAQFDFGLSKKV